MVVLSICLTKWWAELPGTKRNGCPSDLSKPWQAELPGTMLVGVSRYLVEYRGVQKLA